MKLAPTYEELLAENMVMKAQAEAMKANELSLKARIAYLERMLYGAKSDRLVSKVPDNQPGLFDELFQEAMDEKASQIEQMVNEIEKETQKRRTAAKKSPSRPSTYRYTDRIRRTVSIYLPPTKLSKSQFNDICVRTIDICNGAHRWLTLLPLSPQPYVTAT